VIKAKQEPQVFALWFLLNQRCKSGIWKRSDVCFFVWIEINRTSCSILPERCRQFIEEKQKQELLLQLQKWSGSRSAEMLDRLMWAAITVKCENDQDHLAQKCLNRIDVYQARIEERLEEAGIEIRELRTSECGQQSRRHGDGGSIREP
jgi:hypothetical protein